MTTDLCPYPYPAYRDSGVPWLGEVPEHWEVLPGRACYYEKKEPNTGMKEKTVLSLSYGQIVIKPEERLHGLIPASFETYQIVDPGDIIIRPTDLQNDWNSLRFGLSHHRGIITSAYMCFHTKEILDRSYGHLLLHAYDLKKVFYGLGSGLRQNLDWRDFKYLPCCVPPIPEQIAIVRFLGHIDRRIRRSIRAKQKLIKLLEEQKQAIVHQAVTRGLDPNVRLKPSGVEWLGEVPEHWKLAKLARLTARIGDGLHGTPEYVDESGYHFINGNNLSGGHIKITPSTRCVSEAEFQKYRLPLSENTILMSINGTIGNVAFYRGESLVLGKSAAYINCDKSLVRKFLFFFLQSSAVKEFFRFELTGTTIFNLSLASVRNLPVALPPLIEQIEISSFVEAKTADFEAMIGCALHEISLLREYRTRLIADVVTGKLDVREAAANLLPDLVGELEPFDEAESLDENDEEVADVDAFLEGVEA
jgi:type I restriction enzyme S subunit